MSHSVEPSAKTDEGPSSKKAKLTTTSDEDNPEAAVSEKRPKLVGDSPSQAVQISELERKLNFFIEFTKNRLDTNESQTKNLNNTVMQLMLGSSCSSISHPSVAIATAPVG